MTIPHYGSRGKSWAGNGSSEQAKSAVRRHITLSVVAKRQTHSREFPVAFRYGASITQKAQPCKDYSFQQ